MLLRPLFLVTSLTWRTVTARLVMLLAIWRHGDRAPDGLPYPKDRFNESFWPRGWDQLTNQGIAQSYELGHWLRQRYNDFIPPDFNRKEVYIQSSESERALATAQAVAASLFSPIKNVSFWNHSIPWQPTPIHSSGPGRDDALLRPTSIDCPAYERVVEEENAELIRRIDEENVDFFNNLTVFTGYEKINSSNIGDLHDITREIANGLEPQPEWVTGDVLEKLYELKTALRTSKFNSRRKSFYRGGPLLGDWLWKINNAADEKPKKPHYNTVLYSSHDGTVSGLMYAMGVGNNLLVPYAACFIAELHQHETGEFTVKLLFHNGTLNTMTVPGCSEDCPLDEFNELLLNQSISSIQDLYKACDSAAVTSLISPLILFASLLFFMFLDQTK